MNKRLLFILIVTYLYVCCSFPTLFVQVFNPNPCLVKHFSYNHSSGTYRMIFVILVLVVFPPCYTAQDASKVLTRINTIDSMWYMYVVPGIEIKHRRSLGTSWRHQQNESFRLSPIIIIAEWYMVEESSRTEEDGTSTCSRAYYVNKVCVVCN